MQGEKGNVMKQLALIKTYALLFLVMVVWGSNVVMFKVLVSYFPPATMTTFRNIIASSVILIFLLFRKSFRRMSKSEWIHTTLAGLSGITVHHYFLAQGLMTTTASNSALLLALTPLTTAILLMVFLKEKITRIQLFGVLLGLVGVLFVFLFSEQGFSSIKIGDFYVFLAMLGYSVSFIYIRKATMTMDSKQMTGMMLLIGGIFLLVVSLIIEPNGIESYSNGTVFLWFLFLFSAIVSSAIGQMLYNAAIKKIGTGETAIFTNFIPFFGLVFSALFLGEMIRMSQYLSFLIIVLGVLLGTGYFEKKRNKIV